MDQLKRSDFLDDLRGRVFLSTYAAWQAFKPSPSETTHGE